MKEPILRLLFSAPTKSRPRQNSYTVSMKTREREIARAGIFGSTDNPVVVKESDLEEIAQTFPEQKTAPIKLGSHYTEDRPRLAQVTAVRYDKSKKTLYATIQEQDALAKAVDEDGYYPDVSIGAKQRASDGKMYLHHLAYLGDEPPAVKDLENTIAEELKGSEKEPLAASDDGARLIEYPSPKARALMLSDPDPKKQTNPQKEESSMTKEDEEKLTAENAALKAKAAQAEKLLADTYAAKHESEKAALAKACEGKIPEPDVKAVLELADSFAQGKTIELSDGDKKRTESPVSVLAGIFSRIKPQVETGELNLSDPAEKSAPSQTLAARMMGKV